MQSSYLTDVQKNFECTADKPKQKYRAIIFTLEMALYMARWQLSTVTMTPIIILAKYLGVNITWEQVGLANLVCAPFFYFIDKFILVHLRTKIQQTINHFKSKRQANRSST